MNRNTGAGIGSTVAIITGSSIGATTGQWWWTPILIGPFIGIFSGIGWQLGKDAEEPASE